MHYQPLREGVEREVTSSEIYAFIERMRLVRKAEAKLVILLQAEKPGERSDALNSDAHSSLEWLSNRSERV